MYIPFFGEQYFIILLLLLTNINIIGTILTSSGQSSSHPRATKLQLQAISGKNCGREYVWGYTTKLDVHSIWESIENWQAAGCCVFCCFNIFTELYSLLLRAKYGFKQIQDQAA
jgi:hypothetical protein